MKLNKIMSTDVITVYMDDHLALVDRIFQERKFRHLLVVDQKSRALKGVVSDRDLLKQLSPQLNTAAETLKDRAALNRRVHQIMTRQPFTLTPENTIFDAIALFNRERISCIPIVDEKQQVLGIVSWRDLLRIIEERKSMLSSRPASS